MTERSLTLKKSKIFKTRAEDKKWLHKNMLTVKKLIDWLQKQDSDALIYRFETNTGDWQEIPADVFEKGGWIETVSNGKKRDKKYLAQVYRGNKDIDELVKKELKSTYKYTEPNGILIRL